MESLLLYAPKLIVGSLLVYALYYVVICPCDVLVNCHFPETVSALSGALGTILFLHLVK